MSEARRAYHRERRQRIKWKAFEVLGGSCVVCGESDLRLLDIDHIDNDGADHRRTLKPGSLSMATWILRNADAARRRLQVLCHYHHGLKTRLGTIPSALRFNPYSRLRKK